MRYTRELLQEAVLVSHSFSDVARHFGIKASGGGMSHLSRRVRHFGLDTAHFKTVVHNKGTTSPNRKTADEILIILPDGSNRPKRPQLERAMLECGVGYLCSEDCGTSSLWNGKRITLEIDHIDGNWYNNLLDNLRFLCPNCHSQMETSAGWRVLPL